MFFESQLLASFRRRIGAYACLLLVAASASFARTAPAATRQPKVPSGFTITVATIATPVLTGTIPASPSSNPTPTVTGTADPSTPISIFASGSCGGSAVATGTSDALGQFAIPVSVALNATTTLTANAGSGLVISDCSNQVTYRHDDTPPPAPVITGSTPVSPANNNHPVIAGTAEPSALVELFTQAGCLGGVAGAAFATSGGAFSITVSVGDNTVTTFYARATDAAGNPSSCSSGFTYTEDSSIPSGTVCGTVYADLNGNGLFEPGLGEIPLGGWTVYAVSAHGDTSSVLSAGNGQYCFTTLTDSFYTVYEEARQGTMQTGGQPRTGVDFDRSQTYVNVDFGNFVSGTITGAKFNDTLENAVRDPQEPGLPGWSICLTAVSLPAGLQFVPVTATVDLSVNGLGTAAGVNVAGTLLVRRGSTDSVANTIPTEMLALDLRSALPFSLGGETYRLDLRGGSGIPDEDPFAAGGVPRRSYGADSAGHARYALFGRGVLLHLAPGDTIGTVTGRYHNTEAIPLAAAGVALPYPAGTAFAGDSVILRDSAGLPVGSLRLDTLSLGAGGSPLCTLTDTLGVYRMIGLPPGVFDVAEVGQPCWGQVTADPDPVTISSGDSVAGVDFGNRILGSQICLRALFDRNHNQLAGDPDDLPLAGATFTLTGSSPAHTYTGQTDGTGTLCLNNVALDDYILTETPPDGYETILPKSGELPLSVTGCAEDTIAWLNSAAFTDSAFRTATVVQWATALDHAGKRRSVRCKPDKVDFTFTLLWHEGSVMLKFPMYTTGAMRPGTNKQLPPAATWDSVKTVTIDAAPVGAAGDTLRFDGRGFKGKPVSVSYEWRDAALNLIAKGTLPGKPAAFGIDAMTQNDLRYPMPDLHNVGEELERQGAFPIIIGVPADSHSVVHFKYKDVLKSLVKDSRGVLTFHSDSTHCLDFFLNAKPIKKRVKSLPPDKANNGLFAEILALKLNIAASQRGKFPPGLDTLIYDDHLADPTPLDSFSVGEICRMADTLINCFQNPRDLSISPLEYYRIIRRINGAFASAEVDTESWSCVKLVLTGVRPLKEIPFLRANPGSVHPVAVPFLPEPPALPDAYALEQNYPNPFNPTTSIAFSMERPSTVSLAVYNTLGQQVAVLLDNDLLDEGTHEVEFDASGLPSGVYFYRLVAAPVQDDEGTVVPGRYVSVRKMILMR